MELQAAMTADGLSASEQIRELRAILYGYNALKNAFFAPVAVLRMWNVRFAFKLEAWRARSGAAVGKWLRAAGELEALSSLAGYKYENPTDIFPTVEAGPARLTAVGVGHPLLPPDRSVRNDVSLGAAVKPGFAGDRPRGTTGAAVKPGFAGDRPRETTGAAVKPGFAGDRPRGPTGAAVKPDSADDRSRGPTEAAAVGTGTPGSAGDGPRGPTDDTDGPRVLIVSGSNMSGKSTLLRSVGVNCVLALAGGVVRAADFSLTPFALGATMRVQDSLQAGKSRFFAEVTKVRLLLDIATRENGPPLLFLLDELFAGTNSADRVAGAEGVVRALVAAGAIGFVTTHDLSLTAVTDTIPGAVNVHFCDGFAGGELHFDYTMRPGVVPHGNGLALMRAVGLKV
ncbi:MAG: hypothetical protein J0I06_02045 [Planctomycetes bacterium]|nr:hypothetical protein [Planctomycetota bacterium]